VSQTSCIRHPSNTRFLKIYQWQLDFCDGNACAAALMSYFEFCHNGKLQQLEQSRTLNDTLEKTSQGRTQVETLLQWHTLPDLEKAVLFYKREKIAQGVKLLESKGVIELHSNPDPRLWFDRTQHYLFLPEKVNAWINERFPADRECIIGKSMMPGETVISPSIIGKSTMDDRKIDDVQQSRKIDNEVEQESPKNPPKETTTTSVERSTPVAVSPSPVVVVSSLASGDEDPEEIADKLTEEFGLSMPQTRMVWEYLSNQGKGYVLEKAHVVRSEPRENLAGSFVKALEKDWKPKKTSIPPKRQKTQTAIQDSLKELSSEEKQAEVAQMEMRLETAKARWILADADQRSAWLERMDTVSQKLTPMNGSEPRRGFLLCLATILESAREMKSTPAIEQSSELTAGRAIAA
jgi:hypothetical protein